MKWIVELLFLGGVAWFVLTPSAPTCNCPQIPKNYFTVETKETEMCVDEKRRTIVTKITKQGKVEIEKGG
jgi:hypothetical protein